MTGRVYLVGAGPGDPGLITIKGLRCLQEADVVVYDRLVNKRLLEHTRPGAELIFVGKGRGAREFSQEEINHLLVEKATAGKVVARLKGGDPFVFGRGGEEAQALARAGVPFEVVPGVTSAIAAPAYAGIPVTHRGMASAFTVVTGSEDPSKDESSVSWESLASLGGTLVVLMGWEALPRISQALVRGGLAPTTPVAVVQWGTEPFQKTVTGTLEDIAQKAQEAALAPPVVVVVGDVVRLRQELRWFDSRPLFGKRILVTRSRTQASSLSQLLAEHGAQPVELPAIRILPPEDYGPLDSALRSLESYHWVVFTSSNGVEAFFSRMDALGLDSRALAKAKVCAIGPATAQALAQRGIRADYVPPEYLTQAILEGFRSLGLRGSRILLPRTDIASQELLQGLADLGAQVDQVTAYRTVPSEGLGQEARRLLADGRIDMVTFASSSTVRNLVSSLGGEVSLLRDVAVASIGPVTSEAARQAGLKVDVEAAEHTIPGLVKAIVEFYKAAESRHPGPAAG